MAISYVGSASANGESVTLPSHKAGDLIVLAVYRNNTASAPTFRSEWIIHASTGGAVNHILLASKTANSNDTSGTWTGVTQVAAAVYRSDSGKLVLAQRSATTGGAAGSGGNITYPALTALSVVTDKWHVAAAGHRGIDTDIEVAPSGMVNRTSVVGSTAGELVLHDTDSNSASWSATNYTLTTGTSAAWRSVVSEILELDFDIPAGFRMVNIRGGADQ